MSAESWCMQAYRVAWPKSGPVRSLASLQRTEDGTVRQRWDRTEPGRDHQGPVLIGPVPVRTSPDARTASCRRVRGQSAAISCCGEHQWTVLCTVERVRARPAKAPPTHEAPAHRGCSESTVRRTACADHALCPPGFVSETST